MFRRLCFALAVLALLQFGGNGCAGPPPKPGYTSTFLRKTLESGEKLDYEDHGHRYGVEAKGSDLVAYRDRTQVIIPGGAAHEIQIHLTPVRSDIMFMHSHDRFVWIEAYAMIRHGDHEQQYHFERPGVYRLRPDGKFDWSPPSAEPGSQVKKP